MVDDLGARAHDDQRHIARGSQRQLQRRLLRRRLLGRGLRHAVRRGQRLERLRVRLDEREQLVAQEREPFEGRAHVVFHRRIRLLAHGQVAHHGRERGCHSPHVGCRATSARRGSRARQFVDKGGVQEDPPRRRAYWYLHDTTSRPKRAES